jgi:uncharacterized OB-fold protein
MTLLERDPQAPRAWFGNLPVTSRYTFGLAGERFFRALKDEGVIMGSKCPKCARTYVPATIFCERCLSELEEWVDLGTVGTLHTFTVLHVDYDGSHKEEPEIIGFISFGDGGIIHRIEEIDPDDLAFGMQMEAVLKEKSKREGSILDIKYFRPVT